MTNTGIVEFDNPASSYTGTLFGQATGLVIPGNGTISYVVGYAADGTSLVTNTGYAAGMLTSNLLAVAPAVGQALLQMDILKQVVHRSRAST
jgi:hydrogenase/urease accessory protein HupE